MPKRSTAWPLTSQLAFVVAVVLIVTVIVLATSSALRNDRSRTRPTPTTVSPVATGDEKLIPLVVAAPSHVSSYERQTAFGGWIGVDGCRDTRAAVLVRESAVPVTFTGRSACTVATGRWTDPWSGVTTTVAHRLALDHMVPLANAWRSGAWAWTREKRVSYANDVADALHLIPILATENLAKGDSGPEQWKPPNRSQWCTYARVWDRIKAKWNLTATPAEWNTLVAMAAGC